MKRVKFVGSDKDVCGCFIRITHGLCCACEPACFQIQGEFVPLESIYVF